MFRFAPHQLSVLTEAVDYRQQITVTTTQGRQL
jgi:hypothetical protein